MKTVSEHAKALLPETIKSDFPILDICIRGKPLVYLDNAATTQKPKRVIEATINYYEKQNANIRRGLHYLSEFSSSLYDEARKKTQKFINAQSSNEIIFTKGCTEAINLAANSYGRMNFKRGDEVLVSEMEHHSNIVPWQMICEQTGAKLISIHITDDGEIDIEDFKDKLSERTRLVALTHISNALGTINPVHKLIKLAHKTDAVVLIDGAQAVGHIPVDVQELDADFYTFSAHKMYGPTGVGVLYGKKHLLEQMPPYQGGGDMIETVSFEKTTYAPSPRRFEGGTPNIAGVIAFTSAIDYLEHIGIENIHTHETVLTQKLKAILSEEKTIRIIGNPKLKSGITSFVMEGVHPHDIGTILDTEGIAIRAGHHCCMPLMKRLNLSSTARVSFAIYNNENDIITFANAIYKVKEIFYP